MTAYLNGEYMPVEDCRIPANDRGFILGDAVYEVIAVYNNAPFEVEKHLARLEHSLRSSGIPNPHSRAEWHAVFQRLTQNEAADDFGIYLQVSRGVAARDVTAPPGLKPLTFANHAPHQAGPAARD